MITISELDLPEELVAAIFEAGNRKLVLVEGDDDQHVFETAFKKHLSKLSFFSCNGVTKLQEYLEKLRQISANRKYFGIRDRDFSSEDMVNESYKENSFLFYLRRFDIENYLLIAENIWDILVIRHNPKKINDLQIHNVEKVSEKIAHLARKLQILTAADWVICEQNAQKETDRAEYFSRGYSFENQAHIIHKTAQKLDLSEDIVSQKIQEKIVILENLFVTEEGLHTLSDGKRLLHWICKEIEFGDENFFKRMLVDRLHITSQNIHQDLIEIIEKRILLI